MGLDWIMGGSRTFMGAFGKDFKRIFKKFRQGLGQVFDNASLLFLHGSSWNKCVQIGSQLLAPACSETKLHSQPIGIQRWVVAGGALGGSTSRQAAAGSWRNPFGWLLPVTFILLDSLYAFSSQDRDSLPRPRGMRGAIIIRRILLRMARHMELF